MKNKIAATLIAFLIMASSAFALPWKSGQGEMEPQLPGQRTDLYYDIDVYGINAKGIFWGSAEVWDDAGTIVASFDFFSDGVKAWWVDVPMAMVGTQTNIRMINDAGTVIVGFQQDDGQFHARFLRISFSKWIKPVLGGLPTR